MWLQPGLRVMCICDRRLVRIYNHARLLHSGRDRGEHGDTGRHPRHIRTETRGGRAGAAAHLCAHFCQH
jgi:hypothetical protein